MTEQEKKNRFDFVEDLRSLCKDYGWTIDEAMDIIGFELKQNKNQNMIDPEIILDQFIPYEGNYRHYSEEPILEAIKHAQIEAYKQGRDDAIINVEIESYYETIGATTHRLHRIDKGSIQKMKIINLKQ